MLDLPPPNYKTVFSGMVQIIVLKAWKHVAVEDSATGCVF